MATFSNCRTYRFDLWRQWDAARPFALFIGLNPSTADETQNDPTIRRCIGFAEGWGFGALCMTNLEPFKATNPREMIAHVTPDDIQRANARSVGMAACFAGIIIAAWGVHGEGRGALVKRELRSSAVHHLGLTKAGHPRHPLYLRGDTKPILFRSELNWR